VGATFERETHKRGERARKRKELAWKRGFKIQGGSSNLRTRKGAVGKGKG